MDDSPDTPLKMCSKCKNYFPATPDFFYKRNDTKDHLAHSCKRCRGVKTMGAFKPPEGYKNCPVCKQVLPKTTEYFHANKAVSGGLEVQCKACRSAYRKAERIRKHPRSEEPVPPLGHKFCPKCGIAKPLNKENFQSRVQSKDGYRGTCNACRNALDTARTHKRYQENRPKFDESVTKKCSSCHVSYPATPKHFQRNKRKIDALSTECKKCSNKRKKEWALRHPEEMQLRAFRFRQKNREKIRAYVNQHYRTHKEQKYAAKHRRRAAQYGNGGTYTVHDVREQYERQRGQCYWCHQHLNKYHVDHVQPISRGGSNWPENIVLTCPFCNRSKGNKTVGEWLTYLEKIVLHKEA